MFISFYILSFIITFILLFRQCRKEVSLFNFTLLFLVICFGAYYSCRIFSILESFETLSFQNILNPKSGLTFYGGFLFSFFTLLIFGKSVFKDKSLFEDFFLRSIIVFLIGYAIGRLGCHFSADGCYGKVTFNGWGIRYTWGDYQTLFPVYPTPIFEFIGGLTLSMLYVLFYRIKLNANLLIISFFIIFPFGRFFLEFIRVNPPIFYGYTFNQISSIIIIPVLITSYLFTLKLYTNETNKTFSVC